MRATAWPVPPTCSCRFLRPRQRDRESAWSSLVRLPRRTVALWCWRIVRLRVGVKPCCVCLSEGAYRKSFSVILCAISVSLCLIFPEQFHHRDTEITQRCTERILLPTDS